jgi:mannose-6-phosphate isomerase
MLRLENPIQNYAWGSHSAISKLLRGTSPSEKPEAELWLGAHPKAPSRVLPSHESLASLIEREPTQLLGAEVAARYGARLPFLLKVLAAESPLSLQAHPTLEQARAGFDAEEAAHVPLDAPERNYRDRSDKPELLCALTPFTALCGFRSIAQTRELLSTLRAPQLSFVDELLGQLQSEVDLARIFLQLMTARTEHRTQLARDTLDRCTDLAAFEGPFQREFSWAVRIGMLYPGDIGIVTALLLNLVQLAPGEAIYLPAGNLHAYLNGMGMEIMANSDNVLRGGLTPKHVDVPELSRVLDFHAGAVAVLQGETQGSARVYQTSAPEFELQSFDLRKAEAPRVTDRRGPEIVFCERGALELECGGEQLALVQGQALFIAASEPGYVIQGEGRLFRASVGRG